MRRIAALTATLALLPAAGAGGHPGHGPVVISISEFAYAPASVTVVAGDYVFWSWDGPDTNHSVTSDEGQAFAFDSDPKGQANHKTGDGWSVQFTKAGTWTYHCTVHSFMHGTVKVLDAGPAPVVTAPKLSRVSVARHGGRLALRFRISQAASMRASIRRASGGKALREYDFAGPPGANTRTFRLGTLADGRYRFTLTAIDTSTGKATKPVVRSFTIR